MSFNHEAALEEYRTLRQEVLQRIQRVWQLRLAIITTSALLLGLIGATTRGFSSEVAFFVPFLLFVLCGLAGSEIKSANKLITEVSVYIELRLEQHPEFENALGWETLCSRTYAYLKNESLRKRLLREPLPWVAVLQLLCTIMVARTLTPSSVAWIYMVSNLILFGILIQQLWTTTWVDRNRIKADVEKILGEHGLLIMCRGSE